MPRVEAAYEEIVGRSALTCAVLLALGCSPAAAPPQARSWDAPSRQRVQQLLAACAAEVAGGTQAETPLLTSCADEDEACLARSLIVGGWMCPWIQLELGEQPCEVAVQHRIFLADFRAGPGDPPPEVMEREIRAEFLPRCERLAPEIQRCIAAPTLDECDGRALPDL